MMEHGSMESMKTETTPVMDHAMMAMEEKKASAAVAEMTGTQEGSGIKGTIKFTATATGVKVEADFQGVPPGKHGFHIHENGNCGNGGKDAGGHYNPMAVAHGFLPKDGMEHAHMGDMGNVEIDANGTGHLELDLSGISISGENGIAGRAVILHEKEDDFGQPTGNAGGRIGCGIIAVVGE